MAAAFPVVLAVLAVVTLLVPSSAEPETPPELVVERTVSTPERTVSTPEGSVPDGSVPDGSVEEPPGEWEELDEPTLDRLPVDQPSVDGPPVADQPAEDPSPTDVAEQTQQPADEPLATEELVPPDAPPVYFMPVDGVNVAHVPPTFGDPRGSDRTHQGIDILAPRGTPVRSAAAGVVWRTSDSIRGGISVTVISDDGVRYFYTHLDSIAEGIERDVRVGTETVLGYVGNTGNAAATAPHLHFEVALPIPGERYRWRPIDPLLYLLDR